MDNSRELAIAAQSTTSAPEKTRPPLWIATGVFRGEEVPELPMVETYRPWIVVHVDAERPADDTGQPIGKLCPLQ